MAKSQFIIRPSVPSAYDEAFILAAFDSTLPYLDASGNGGMWGLTPFSQKESFVQDSKDDLVTAKHFRETGEGERLLTRIAEIDETDTNSRDGQTSDNLHRYVDKEGRHMLSVGIMDMRDEAFADHLDMVASLAPILKEARERGNFAYIDMLASDQRVGPRRSGVGIALIEHGKEYARQQGKRSLFVDCWTGGTDNLVRYYERLGFVSVAEYQFPRRDGSIWPGRLFRLEL